MKQLACLVILAASWRATAPWNFPPAHEWNAPMEMSWVNLVDNYRKIGKRETVWIGTDESWKGGGFGEEMQGW